MYFFNILKLRNFKVKGNKTNWLYNWRNLKCNIYTLLKMWRKKMELINRLKIFRCSKSWITCKELCLSVCLPYFEALLQVLQDLKDRYLYVSSYAHRIRFFYLLSLQHNLSLFLDLHSLYWDTRKSEHHKMIWKLPYWGRDPVCQIKKGFRKRENFRVIHIAQWRNYSK